MANWKIDFIQELVKISSKFNMKDYHAFIFWYIKATTDLQSNDAINDLITDRSKDGGSDAIFPEFTTKTIKIIQSKYSPNIGETPFNKDELNKLNRICDYLLGKIKFDDIREYVHKGLKGKLDIAYRLIKEDGYQLKPTFITTHRANPNCKININRDCPIQIIVSREIEIKYNEWLHGHTPDLGELSFEYLGIMEGPEDPKSYLLNIKSIELGKKYLLFKDKLFSRNVRIYQQKYKPNKAIKDTLLKFPEYFWYFNNGITILAERITLKEEDKIIILKNPQIINGCQTVTTIGENKESEASLFVKIVEVEDDISNQYLIDGIIEANNRQTPVDERMLKSNHPLQVKLQRELDTLGYYYERKEGQFQEERSKSKHVAGLRCIKNINVIKAKIALIKSPNHSFSTEDDLFSTDFNDVFKTTNSCMDYLIPFLIWQWIEWTGRHYNRGKARKNFHRIVSWHILRLIYDYNPSLKISTQAYEYFKIIKSDEISNSTYSTIKKLIDLAFKAYCKSDFKGGYGEQRDFLKSKDSYSLIAKGVNKALERDIKKMFDE